MQAKPVQKQNTNLTLTWMEMSPVSVTVASQLGSSRTVLTKNNKHALIT